MNATFTGPVAQDIERRLRLALSPTRLDLDNQSARHHGHAGDNGSGESHFALTIESAAFTGMTRVQRQRAVYAALGDLMVERVHALSIKAFAPGE